MKLDRLYMNVRIVFSLFYAWYTDLCNLSLFIGTRVIRQELITSESMTNDNKRF